MTDHFDRMKHLENIKRMVVKLGSGLLTEKAGLNLDVISSITHQVSELIDRKVEVVIVSSGAMAAGLKKAGLLTRPEEIPKRQAISAIGQAGLMMEYEKAFTKHGKLVAQILLTSDDILNRKRYLNARNTLYTLLSWKVVPIINENDTVRIEEIQLGDNDNLAAMIALLLDADLLVNLTDTQGLYDKDPRLFPDAKLLGVVNRVTRSIEKMAGTIPGPLGLGGMLSKIKAAKKTTSAGIPMVIADGRIDQVLFKIIAGHKIGTFFVPVKEKMAGRKRWIASTFNAKGAVIIDRGAVKAILEKGKSLLPSGVLDVTGNFRTGDPVEVKNPENDTVARGLVNYSSDDIRRIKGLKTIKVASVIGSKPFDEIIHRNNMVLTD